jgi:hypothetical protein
MKWRTSFIYLLVLLLLGGYYYYYEVIVAERKEAAEKASKQLLTFDADQAKQIEIRSANAKPIRLEKKDAWRIVEPVNSDVDRVVFDDFFSTLKDTEKKREIELSSSNLDEFGLKTPALTIRILVGEQWLELQGGGSNPTGDARYVRVGADGPVSLIPRSAYDALSKGLRDFRKKELFTWMPDQVTALDINWQSGEKMRVERQAGTHEWKASDRPDLKLKTNKVENVLDQLHWLRAVDFLEPDAMPQSAMVEVKLTLKDGRTNDLKVASPDPATKQAIASCTDVPEPVKIASQIVSSLPTSPLLLADRSLISSNPADIREVSWKIPEGEGKAVWIDSDQWGAKQGDSPPKPFADPLSVKLLLTDLDGMEYANVIERGPNPPKDPPNFVRFKGIDQKEGALSWDTLPEKGGDPVTVWLEKDGQTRAVAMQYDSMQRLKMSLTEMTQAVQGKKTN